MARLTLGLNADPSASAACQRTPGEGLDGDGGLSDHEEQLSDHNHAVGLLEHESGLGVAQSLRQAASKSSEGSKAKGFY